MQKNRHNEKNVLSKVKYKINGQDYRTNLTQQKEMQYKIIKIKPNMETRKMDTGSILKVLLRGVFKSSKEKQVTFE